MAKPLIPVMPFFNFRADSGLGIRSPPCGTPEVSVVTWIRAASRSPTDDQFTVMVPCIPIGGVPSTPWIVQ